MGIALLQDSKVSCVWSLPAILKAINLSTAVTKFLFVQALNLICRRTVRMLEPISVQLSAKEAKTPDEDASNVPTTEQEMTQAQKNIAKR